MKTDNDASRVGAEPVRLPETVEEFQKRQRDAFFDGAAWMYERNERVGWPNVAVERAAREYAPIRKKVPREVAFPNGKTVTARYAGHDEVEFFASGKAHSVHVLCASDLDVIRDLLANPYEEVEE